MNKEEKCTSGELSFSYEDAVSELNGILEKLERKDCPLQEMLDLTKRGLLLVETCAKTLDSYEGSIKECIPEDEADDQ